MSVRGTEPDEHSLPKPPLFTRLRREVRSDGGLSIMIPPPGIRGVDTAVLGLAAGLLPFGAVWIGIWAFVDRVPAPLIAGSLLITIGLGFALHAASLARRRGEIVVTPNDVQVTELGLYKTKAFHQPIDRLTMIDVAATGMTVNDRPVHQATFQAQDERRRGFFRHLNDDELEWIADSVRAAVEGLRTTSAPGAEMPESKVPLASVLHDSIDFGLTLFDDWKPGSLVRIRNRTLSGFEKGIGIALAGGLLGAILWFIVPIVSMAVLFALTSVVNLLAGDVFSGKAPVGGLGGKPLFVFGALLGPAIVWVLLEAALPPREVLLDWITRRLTVTTRGASAYHAFSEIQALEVRSVVGAESVSGGSSEKSVPRNIQVRTQFRARLDAVLRDDRVMICDTDEWQSSADRPLERITAVANELASALDVEVCTFSASVDSIVRPRELKAALDHDVNRGVHRDEWDFHQPFTQNVRNVAKRFRNTSPLPRIALVLVCSLIVVWMGVMAFDSLL